jgi:ATP-dependent RNA helicase DeaD
LLRSIERLTRQRITIATIPTVADLRSRRLELTRASLREAIVAGDLDRFRPIVEELAGEFDPLAVAAAAVKLAHREPNETDVDEGDDDGEEPEVVVTPRRGAGRKRGAKSWDSVRLYIGAGRADAVRPGDVVGAIANEAGIGGRSIGAIEIGDRFSTVEVPADRAEAIIRALRKTTIRGRSVAVRIFEER